MRRTLLAGMSLMASGVVAMFVGWVLLKPNSQGTIQPVPTIFVLLGIALLYAGSRWISFGKALERGRNSGKEGDGWKRRVG